MMLESPLILREANDDYTEESPYYEPVEGTVVITIENLAKARCEARKEKVYNVVRLAFLVVAVAGNIFGLYETVVLLAGK